MNLEFCLIFNLFGSTLFYGGVRVVFSNDAVFFDFAQQRLFRDVGVQSRLVDTTLESLQSFDDEFLLELFFLQVEVQGTAAADSGRTPERPRLPRLYPLNRHRPTQCLKCRLLHPPWSSGKKRRPANSRRPPTKRFPARNLK